MSATKTLVIARAHFPETGKLLYTLVWDEDDGKVVHVDAPNPMSVERMLAVDARMETLVGVLAPSAKVLAQTVRSMGGRIGRWRQMSLTPFFAALYRRGAPVWSHAWSPDDEEGLLEANAESKVGLSDMVSPLDDYRNDILATVVLSQRSDGTFSVAGAADGAIELVLLGVDGSVLRHEILLGDTEATNALLPPDLALPA